ncbi:Hypothetical protein Cul210931_2166 [Corynebacterium ulcerans]|uniref:DUF2075 domain-containing protein n=1 Tax=Corynebacterium ulcerans TaxID=65058 RepID=UPI000521122F|nr:DUF2075 domain-containing protein [Corynebacterium ulcerans]AIU31478.1 Hypothetical protein Cul210931_2166 [Corynebacterium ulcerans]AIU92744.1 Hypothetical protein Cul05146_2206 [Corynebacterium ulcerans]NOL63090.1 DUF2075 domain-containing protein [Corynebacterium ulcerans]NON17035.1 DUF2075 domain-containing protein [Corynebacterium ulcerans]
MRIQKPEIAKVPYAEDELTCFINSLRNQDTPAGAARATFLLDYPTVYIIHDKSTNSSAKPSSYSVYVGETTDIHRRTLQHVKKGLQKRPEWQHFADSNTAEMYVVGHPLFNKSLTLDIEHRLIHYMLSMDTVSTVLNSRGNQQNKYYTQEHFDQVFTKIWKGLRTHDSVLFPAEKVIKDSALFKASPFHKLTREQIEAKEEVLHVIEDALRSDATGQLIRIHGEAGSGKTVLLSSLFYELTQGKTSASDPDDTFIDPMDYQPWNAFLLVNHIEQLTVYQQIAQKLMIVPRGDKRISRPTTFINNNSPEKAGDIDVVLIDEAHLLWTQGKQSYRGKNQLLDILERARVVVAIFDEKQILQTNQYWEDHAIEELEKRTTKTIHLKNQMRIDADAGTVSWIRSIIDDGIIGDISLDENNRDSKDYEIKVFDSPTDLHAEVKAKASSVEQGLSRLIATFDWKYSSTAPTDGSPTWNVTIGDFSIPWNLETNRSLTPSQKRRYSHQAWAERDYTVDEIGSTFTIQGFDLNYAGVILGPSVIYRDGKIRFDPSKSANKNATNKRTTLNKEKIDLGAQLIRNELNVLLTRGIHGLYVYAVDDELRHALSAKVNS